MTRLHLALVLALCLGLCGCSRSLASFTDDAGLACDPLSVADDPNNCGSCGLVCPTPLNADARCVAGLCGRGPCAGGFFDVDGAATPGCESTCVDLLCTLPDGSTVTLSASPVPERGAAGGGPSSAAAAGTGALTGGPYRLIGTLGGPSIASPMAAGTHLHYGGLSTLEK